MQKMPLKCVDLIYLDPPFNSKKNYNLMYKTMTGKPVPEQADAFCDTWDLTPEKEEMALSMPKLMRDHGIDAYYVEFWRLWMNALRETQPHLLAYLIYMVERLIYMKTLLRPSGSIYLHCDPTASHYIKVIPAPPRRKAPPPRPPGRRRRALPARPLRPRACRLCLEAQTGEGPGTAVTSTRTAVQR